MNNFDGYLLSEATVSAKPKIIVDKRDCTIIETILQEAEVPNRNGRIYSKSCLLSGVMNPRIQEQLKKKTLVGECGHPLSEDIKRQTNIDHKRISHIITDMAFEGNLLKGTVESANTMCGRDFQGLCRQGMEMAFSMRGLGGVAKKEGGYDRIDGKLYLITYDWVIFPSHDNAYMTKILKEDVDLTKKSDILLNEGFAFKVNMQEALHYIAESSTNVKELAEHMKFDITKDNLSYDPRMKTLDIKNESEVLKVILEHNMEREIDNLFKNL